MFSIQPAPRLEHLVTNGRWQMAQRATLAVVDSATVVPAALLWPLLLLLLLLLLPRLMVLDSVCGL
jgi:hypothetical protein